MQNLKCYQTSVWGSFIAKTQKKVKIIITLFFTGFLSGLMSQSANNLSIQKINREVISKQEKSQVIIKRSVEDERIFKPVYSFREKGESSKISENRNNSSEISIESIYGLIDRFFEGEPGVTLDYIYKTIDKYFDQ